MRSGFGKRALELRLLRGLSQTDFSKRTSYSLQRISNIEHQRSNISDDVVGTYIRVLNASGQEADALRKLARFSNAERRQEGENRVLHPLQAMMAEFGEKISPKSAAKIQEILEQETGERLATLRFASNQAADKKSKSRKSQRSGWSEITPRNMVDICDLSLEFRRQFVADSKKLDVGHLLEQLSHTNSRFDYQVVETMQAQLNGAFACIKGHVDGHTVVLEAERFGSALRGVTFARHVICHEVAHHRLHAGMLESDQEIYALPQSISRNSARMIGTDEQIRQVVDTVEEAEAELFAAGLLVPWVAHLKGTELRYLADDYGEELGTLKRFNHFLMQDSVLDGLRERLWLRGERQHLIFGFERSGRF
ncbi:helix-turn-helix domain-containing protein [Gymnodinialimonas sp. 2305UL16-5]|uniref:helix-turn-helix domain-containing protein n=1 Tax=Gymnodinialimonas mytili TaxID=3126503 RepID=UPI0030B43960